MGNLDGMRPGDSRVGIVVGYADVNLLDYKGIITDTRDGVNVLVAWRDRGGVIKYRRPCLEWAENLRLVQEE